jgi:hypothetical protein
VLACSCVMARREEGFPVRSCRLGWSMAMALGLQHKRSITTAIQKRLADGMAILFLSTRPMVHAMLPQGRSQHSMEGRILQHRPCERKQRTWRPCSWRQPSQLPREEAKLPQRQRQGACEHPTSCCVATRGRGRARDQSFLSETSTSRFLIQMNETPCRLSRNLAAPEYPCFVDVTDFCTDGDGVIAHVGSYANNGRFV